MAIAFPSPSSYCRCAVISPKPPANPSRIVFSFSSSHSLRLSLFRRPQPLSSTTAFARRKRTAGSTASRRGTKKFAHEEEEDDDDDDGEEEDEDEDGDGYHDAGDDDPLEALFQQLEYDLKRDEELSGRDMDGELTEEDFEKADKELEDMLGDDDTGDPSGPDSHVLDLEEEIQLPKLKTWQLRRLAVALKVGRRKTAIKVLSAELGLDRAMVLEILRRPPPSLLMMSASLPDEIVESPVVMESTNGVEPPSTPEVLDVKPEPKKNVPVHVMRVDWLNQKRLKKVQVATLEKVYRRTKRPTDAMVSSIVYLTNLPWKKVVKWFETKRLQDGIQERRRPYRRSMATNSTT